MARNSEALVILLDVSPSMHPNIKDAVQFITEQMNQKLLFNPKDEVCIIVFGCDETNNDLNREMGDDYRNVSVIYPLKMVDIDVFPVLDGIKGGHAPGDFINAVIVAMDLFIKTKGTGKASKKDPKTARKSDKNILLITDAASHLQPPGEGMTMEDQVSQVGERLGQEIKVDVILVQREQTLKQRVGLALENEVYIKMFAAASHGEVKAVPRLTLLMNKVKPRVAPTTSYRGDLEITPFMSIKVWIYKKTMQQKFPSLKLYSDKAPSGDPTASRQVKVEREYKLTTDTEVSVPPDEQVKAYRYGPQIVPISSLDRATLMFKAEKGMKLIGFTTRASIPRHYFMKDVSLVIPEPTNTEAALAVSALARALDAERKVAIVRVKMVDRKDLGVTVGVLTPNIAERADLMDSFFLNNLPFAEDIREFSFASFSDRPAEQQPSQAQVETAERLIRLMDLGPAEASEAYPPDSTANPVLQRYYKFVHAKFRDPEAAVPPLDPDLQRIIEPPPAESAMADKALRSFKEAFPLAPAERRGRSSRRFWSDRLADVEAAAAPPEPQEEDTATGNGAHISLEDLANRGPPEEVGRATPVHDFKAMMARTDSDQWVPRAINGMKKVVEDLLDAAYNGNTYPRALDCLVALREGCVIQQEPQDFNKFLPYIKTKCKDRRHNDFWKQILAKGMTLIHKEEADDSDVTPQEAAKFIADIKEENTGVSGIEEEEDEMENLLDEVE